jgi:hypothetical protein
LHAAERRYSARGRIFRKVTRCVFCGSSGSRGRAGTRSASARGAPEAIRTSSTLLLSRRKRGRHDDRREGGARPVRVARPRWRRDACARAEHAQSPSCQSVYVCVCVLLGISSAVKCARQSDEAPSSPVQNRRVFVFDASTEAFPGEKQRAGDG